MIDFLSISLLVIFVFGFSYLDFKIFKTKFTPFILFSIPTTIFILLTYFFSNSVGFSKINTIIVYPFLFGFLFFWLGGYCINIIVLKEFTIKVNEKILYSHFPKSKLLNTLNWIITFILLSRLYYLLFIKHLPLYMLERYYGSHGIFAHLLVFNIAFFIYLICSFKKTEKLKIIAIILTFTTIAFYQVKAWFILPIIVSFFYKLTTNNFKLNIWKILFFSILLFLVFISTYFISSGFNYNINFLIHHFIKYNFAGILGFNVYYIKDYPFGIFPSAMFEPFTTILKSLFNLNLAPSYIIPNKGLLTIGIGKYNYEQSNVYTMIGSLLIQGGYIRTSIYLFILGMLTYLLLFVTLIKNNKWLYLIYLYIITLLFMNFFANYFNLLNAFEIPFWLFVLYVFEKYKITFK